MKKILYMNLLFNNAGQRRMDENIINQIVKIADVYVVAPEGWYASENKTAKYIYYEPTSIFKSGTISNYDKEIKNMLFVKKINDRYNFDGFFFASFETAIFELMVMLLGKDIKNTFILHNNNIDRFNEVPLKKKLFNRYKNKVNHVVLESFISYYLKKECSINDEQVFTLPHPLNMNLISKKEIMYECIGISNSNDEEWISKIIGLERQYERIKRNGKHVVLRSKDKEFDNGYLKVIKGWLNDEMYNNYINCSKAIFLPFPQTFRYRMSGSVVDAFSNKKYVIGSNIPLLKYYEKQYNGICKTISCPDEFYDVVTNIPEIETTGFKQFVREHNNTVILENLKRMIDKI